MAPKLKNRIRQSTVFEDTGISNPAMTFGTPVSDSQFRRLMDLARSIPDQKRSNLGDVPHHRTDPLEEAEAAYYWLYTRIRDMSLEQVLEFYAMSPRSRAAGRIITHPEATPEAYRTVARTVRKYYLLCALADIPEAIEDREVREELFERGLGEAVEQQSKRTKRFETALLNRVLPYCKTQELRDHFHTLAQQYPRMALQILEQDFFDARNRLDGSAMAPLMKAPNSEVRSKALLLSHKLWDEEAGGRQEERPDKPITIKENREMDPARIARAENEYAAEHVVGKQYRLYPKDPRKTFEYFVSLETPAICPCPDEVYRPDTPCKHLIAALKVERKRSRRSATQ